MRKNKSTKKARPQTTAHDYLTEARRQFLEADRKEDKRRIVSALFEVFVAELSGLDLDPVAICHAIVARSGVGMSKPTVLIQAERGEKVRMGVFEWDNIVQAFGIGHELPDMTDGGARIAWDFSSWDMYQGNGYMVGKVGEA